MDDLNPQERDGLSVSKSANVRIMNAAKLMDRQYQGIRDDLAESLALSPEALDERVRELRQPNGNGHANGTLIPELDTIRLSQIQAKPIVPIWPGVLYRGKVTVIAGVPGDGKSLSSEDIAARMSMAKKWPCGNGTFEHKNVLLLTAEDDVADTIRPRIDVAGGDCAAIEVIRGAYETDPKAGTRALVAVSLIEHLPALERRIVAIGAGLLIIDPLTSFATSDTNKTADMRRLFDAVAQLAARTDIAILVITHLNKRSDARKAMQMVAGSHVIVAAVRVALVTARDPNDKARRLVLPVKINIDADEGGFAFRIGVTRHPVCGDTPLIEWENGRVTDIDADDALIDATPRAQAAIEKSSEVQAWLREAVKAPLLAASLWRMAEEKGFSERRVRTSLKAIGAICEVAGYQGRWHYRLPESDGKSSHA